MPPIIHRILTPTTLITTIVLSSLTLVATILIALLDSTSAGAGHTYELPLRNNDINHTLPTITFPHSPGEYFITQTISISAMAHENPFHPIATAALYLPDLTIALTCGLFIIVSTQLLDHKPFSRFTTLYTVLLSLTTIITAIAPPAIEKHNILKAIQINNLPYDSTYPLPETTTHYVSYLSWDPLQDTNWLLLLLGIAFLYFSYLTHRAYTLNKDLQGTV